MRIKQSTIDRHRLEVDNLLSQKKWVESLEIAGKYPLKTGHNYGYVICKTRLLSEYRIKKEDLDTLSQYVKKNPHYSSAPNMVLFLEDEVKERFKLRNKTMK